METGIEATNLRGSTVEPQKINRAGIRRMKNLALEGKPYAAIADTMMAEGWVSPRGKDIKLGTVSRLMRIRGIRNIRQLSLDDK